MSISSSHFLAVRAPAFNTPLYFRRQFFTDEENSDDLKMQCDFKTKRLTAKNCPKSVKPIEKCFASGAPLDDDNTPFFSDKESCIEMCNMLHSNEIISESKACMKDQCTNYEEYDQYITDTVMEALHVMLFPGCTSLGLTAVVSTTSGGKSPTETIGGTSTTDESTTESSKDAKTTDDAEASKESGAATDKSTTESSKDAKTTDDAEALKESSTTTDDKDEGSGAAGLASGWKGTSLVVAVLFGSLFSGLML